MTRLSACPATPALASEGLCYGVCALNSRHHLCASGSFCCRIHNSHRHTYTLPDTTSHLVSATADVGLHAAPSSPVLSPAQGCVMLHDAWFTPGCLTPTSSAGTSSLILLQAERLTYIGVALQASIKDIVGPSPVQRQQATADMVPCLTGQMNAPQTRSHVDAAASDASCSGTDPVTAAVADRLASQMKTVLGGWLQQQCQELKVSFYIYLLSLSLSTAYVRLDPHSV